MDSHVIKVKGYDFSQNEKKVSYIFSRKKVKGSYFSQNEKRQVTDSNVTKVKCFGSHETKKNTSYGFSHNNSERFWLLTK